MTYNCLVQIQLQAEMFKMMGLWPVALGLLLDAADWTCSRLGFDAEESLCALVSVSACLRKMDLAAEAAAYVKKTCAQLEYFAAESEHKKDLAAALKQKNKFVLSCFPSLSLSISLSLFF